MDKIRNKFLLLVLGALVVSFILAACGNSAGSSMNDPNIPHLTKDTHGVIDPTNTVNQNTLQALRNASDVFEQEGFQLAVVFFHDCVQGDEAKVAADFGNQNGIGSAKTDNGMVIMVLLDRKGDDGNKPYIFVATGKGLEGLLPDIKLTRFREVYFNPQRANGQWEQGLITLTQKFGEYLKTPDAQEFSDQNLSQAAASNSFSMPWWGWTLLIIGAFLLFGLIGLAVRLSGGFLHLARSAGNRQGPWNGPWGGGLSLVGFLERRNSLKEGQGCRD